jgi:lipoprotein-releasing system permease protein
MQFPYELQLGWRYTRAGRASGRNGFISFISGVSMLGIALGVATLIIVLSVMNGFQKDVRDRMLSALPAVKVMSLQGEGIPNWELFVTAIKQVPEVLAVSPLVQEQVLLTNGDEMIGAIVSGIDPQQEAHITEVAAQLHQRGDLQKLAPGSFGIILGDVLARQLRVQVGGQVTIVAPTGQMTPAGVMPRLKQMTVVGIFSSGHYQYDAGMVMINIEDAQRLFRVDGPTGIRVEISDMQRAQQVNQAIRQRLGQPDMAQAVKDSRGLYVTDWTRENQEWFKAVQVERRMLFIILTLIVAVAAFNLVSTLVMTVTDKRADIAILRTLGARPASIMSIFMVQGATVGVLGTFLGVGFGTLIAYYVGPIVGFIEALFGVRFIDGGVYFLNYLPSDPRLSDILTITAISLALAFVATIYPSWRASRVNPAEALRYE